MSSSPSAKLTSVFAALLALGAAGAGYAASADGDIWWHLAAGREMVHGGALLRTDPFSVSASGRPWFDVHWLFQLVTYAGYELGGLGALVGLKCGLLALGALGLFSARKRRASEQVLLVALLLGALFAARSLLLLRPVIFTLFFLSAFVFVLERYRKGGDVRSLAWLPALQVLWVNCQGLSPFGPALVAAYAFGALVEARYGARARFPFRVPAAESGERASRSLLRPLALCLVACAAASFVTPFGLGAVLLPGKLLGRLIPAVGNVYPNVVENVPPLLLEQLDPGQFVHLPVFLLLLALAFVASAGRLWLHEVLVVVAALGLALLANRNVVLLYWLATPVLAASFAPHVEWLLARLDRRRAKPLAALLAGGALGASLCALCLAAAREPSVASPTPFRMPVESAEIIAARGGVGKLFSADQQGGYLSWRLYPEFRPFMDTRLVLRTAQEFADYLQVIDEPARFDDLDRVHGFRYVVLPVAYPERYLALAARLYRDPAWQLIFTNGSEVLFARAEETPNAAAAAVPDWDLGRAATSERILAAARVRYVDARLFGAERLHLATLQLALGEHRECARLLAGSEGALELAVRARCLVAEGELDTAAALATKLLSMSQDDVSGLGLLALVHARRGDRPRALTFLKRALSRDPFDAEANSLLASLEVSNDGQH